MNKVVFQNKVTHVIGGGEDPVREVVEGEVRGGPDSDEGHVVSLR